MISEMIVPSDSRWGDFLEQVPHDYYHTPQYLELSSRYECGEPIAFWAEDDHGTLLIPLISRQFPEGYRVPANWRDLTSPYGYASPIFLAKSPCASIGRYLEEFIHVSYDLDYVSVFLRLHPLFPLKFDYLPDRCTLVRHGQTVTMDLSLDDDQAWREMRENHRKGIKKLIHGGYQAEMDNGRYWNDFIRIYRETMKRVNATDFYFFSDSYFEDLKAHFEEKVHLCTVTSPGGELAAAGLFFTSGVVVEFHLAGTAGCHAQKAPSKLMFEHVRRWAREAGCTSLHIGGGVGGGNDSLFNFKIGFSKQVNDFYTMRIIVNSERYTETSLNTGCEEGSIDGTDGFFPVYRSVH